MRSSCDICSSTGCQSSNAAVRTVRPTRMMQSRPGGQTTSACARCVRGAVVSPDTIVTGNSSPFEACTVMMRTASSSVSGRTASATRLPSAVCWRIHARYCRSVPLVASVQRPGLVGDEPDPSPQVAGAAVGLAQLEDPPVADDPVDELAR